MPRNTMPHAQAVALLSAIHAQVAVWARPPVEWAFAIVTRRMGDVFRC